MSKGRELIHEKIMNGSKNSIGTVLVSLFVALFAGLIFVYAGGVLFQWFNGYAPVTFSPLAAFAYGRTIGKNQTILVAGITIIIGVIIFIKRQSKHGNDDDRDMKISKRATYGTARFLSREEAKKKLEVGTISKVNGVILGKLGKEVVALPQDTMFNKHILVMGAPGSRKSRSFVRPMIMQSVKNGQSCLVTDPKGELYRDTAVYLREAGYDVKVFNLVDPKYSDSWACLNEINGDLDMAAVFADVIVSNISGTDLKKADFWTDSAKNLLKAIVLYVEQNGKMRREGTSTIGEAYKMIATSTVAELESLFSGISVDHPAHMAFQIFAGASPQVKESIKHELGVFLEVFQNESIRNITSYPEIDLEKPAYDKCAYFVIISDQHSTLNFLSSLFFSFLFIKIVNYADNKTDDGRCPVQVNMILDEFPSIGIISGYIKKLSTVRGRGISCSHCIQNLSQLIEMYGKNYESILSNCDTHIFLGGNDPTTIKYVSDRSGVIGVDQESIRSRRRTLAPVQIIPDYQLNKGEGKRNLLNQDEVYTLDPNKSIVFVRSLHALKVDKIDFTEHPDAERFVQENALSHIPEWVKSRNQRRKPAATAASSASSTDTVDSHDADPAPRLADRNGELKASDETYSRPKRPAPRPSQHGNRKLAPKPLPAVKKEKAKSDNEEQDNMTVDDLLHIAARPNRVISKAATRQKDTENKTDTEEPQEEPKEQNADASEQRLASDKKGGPWFKISNAPDL